jgi:hypothetical protein
MAVACCGVTRPAAAKRAGAAFAAATPSPAQLGGTDKAPTVAARATPAATGAAPTPPEMAGSMKDMTSVVAPGWRAHLASHRTESAAINEWQELLKGNPSLYGQYDPLVEWVDTPNRGAFARLVLVGFAERKDADAACAKIRSSTRYCASVRN